MSTCVVREHVEKVQHRVTGGGELGDVCAAIGEKFVNINSTLSACGVTPDCTTRSDKLAGANKMLSVRGTKRRCSSSALEGKGEGQRKRREAARPALPAATGASWSCRPR